MRPLFSVALVPSTPMKEDRLATSGSFRMPSASALLALGHGVEGDDLRRLGDGLDQAGVLHREEALGDHDVEHDGQHDGADRDSRVSGWWRNTTTRQRS